MTVLKKMKLNKSPGNDGLSTEFYVLFWSVIGDIVVGASNESYTIRRKQAVITLIQKEGKDPLNIKKL